MLNCSNSKDGPTVDIIYPNHRVETLPCCPVKWRFDHPMEGAMLEHYLNWDKGILPKSGGWDDQPALIQQGITILSREMGRIENARMEAIRNG